MYWFWDFVRTIKFGAVFASQKIEIISKRRFSWFFLGIKDRRARGWRLAMQKMSSPLVVKRLYKRPVRLDKGKMNPPGRPLFYNKPSPPRLPLLPFSLTRDYPGIPKLKTRHEIWAPHATFKQPPPPYPPSQALKPFVTFSPSANTCSDTELAD